MKSIINRNLWYNLKNLIEIFKPFHDCQIMSKFGDIYLDYIIKIWKTIEFYLQFLYNHVGF